MLVQTFVPLGIFNRNGLISNPYMSANSAHQPLKYPPVQRCLPFLNPLKTCKLMQRTAANKLQENFFSRFIDKRDTTMEIKTTYCKPLLVRGDWDHPLARATDLVVIVGLSLFANISSPTLSSSRVAVFGNEGRVGVEIGEDYSVRALCLDMHLRHEVHLLHREALLLPCRLHREVGDDTIPHRRRCPPSPTSGRRGQPPGPHTSSTRSACLASTSWTSAAIWAQCSGMRSL